MRLINLFAISILTVTLILGCSTSSKQANTNIGVRPTASNIPTATDGDLILSAGQIVSVKNIVTGDSFTVAFMSVDAQYTVYGIVRDEQPQILGVGGDLKITQDPNITITFTTKERYIQEQKAKISVHTNGYHDIQVITPAVIEEPSDKST